MKSRNAVPLETLLYDLIYSTEEDKRAAFIRAAVRALREACRVNVDAPSRRFRGTAELAVRALDRLLGGEAPVSGRHGRCDTIVFSTPASSQPPDKKESSALVSKDEEMVDKDKTDKVEKVEKVDKVEKVERVEKKREDGTDEEDFLQSSVHKITSVDEEGQAEGAQSSISQLVKQWNTQADSWMRLPPIKSTNPDNVVAFVKAVAALYSNLNASMGSSMVVDPGKWQNFEKWWGQIIQGLANEQYNLSPRGFGNIDGPVGHCIYAACPRLNTVKYELIVPAIQYKGEEISQAVTLVNTPSDTPYPDNHPDKDLPTHLRGVIGEMEHLLQHLEIQRGVFCAVEGVNKTHIQPFEQCRTRIIEEIKRRAEAIKVSIASNEATSYRLATDYWRVEECFWAVFHEDNRPLGYSYFDRLRNRIQMWRSVIRRILKIQIRDFAPGIDSLASINQFLGNIIIKNVRGMAPGMVVRELRPAIMVKADNTTRILKGRVIST